MQDLRLTVNGMTCQACEQRIARAVKSLDGISLVEPDHVARRVRVVFAPQRVSERAIRQAIEHCGFEVVS